ncbi:hypothetical protein GCM10011349_45980 [Novosphingobium indicum]|uniref:Uncharacterized protein n=1 Tax=Novosphingobium indicum TaxID=462949 RepID=A0ABQ2K015_9SPHN|nr:hypothetical protein GCM10011349_45980 [Novosphingobium indicum]
MGIERHSKLVFADFDQIGQPVGKTKHHQNVTERAYADARISFLQAGYGTWRSARAHGQIGHRDASAQARAAQISAKPLKGVT